MKYDPVQLTIGILIGQANAFCFTGRIIGFWVCLSTLGRYRSLGQLTDKQAFKALELYQKWTSPEITGGPQQLATFHEDGDDGDS